MHEVNQRNTEKLSQVQLMGEKDFSLFLCFPSAHPLSVCWRGPGVILGSGPQAPNARPSPPHINAVLSVGSASVCVCRCCQTQEETGCERINCNLTACFVPHNPRPITVFSTRRAATGHLHVPTITVLLAHVGESTQRGRVSGLQTLIGEKGCEEMVGFVWEVWWISMNMEMLGLEVSFVTRAETCHQWHIWLADYSHDGNDKLKDVMWDWYASH